MTNQKLTIATWNLDRPKFTTRAKNKRIHTILNETDADIWVLTETNSCISPGHGYIPFSTPPLIGSSFKKGERYDVGENRVTIWIKKEFQAVEVPEKCHSHSSICVAVNAPLGAVNVYGTVIGIYGRGEDFDSELELQIQDWRNISENDEDICIVGDFNTSFVDSFYYTKFGRQKIVECFKHLKIKSLTSEIPENIDHIVFSKSFLKDVSSINSEWNQSRDKKLSDHQGVLLTLTRA